MSNQSTSIRQALTLDPALPALVAQASRLQAGFVGFYFDEAAEEWAYWTAEAADASASNYYTPAECREILISRGFPEMV